jgi:hypothetical protein
MTASIAAAKTTLFMLFTRLFRARELCADDPAPSTHHDGASFKVVTGL